ncbi:hypothetical protein [Paraburkholderia kururiensis]|uniref:hypothetical protein n=1 Tax=Paraburkholderia kururiensis TaxID=984307 RepID=UPI000F8896A7|nr:hypothetical protein [Paraburkholderia kururiensis]
MTHMPHANQTDAIASDPFALGFALLFAVLSAGRAEQAHERKALTFGNKVDNRNGQSVSRPKKFRRDLTLTMTASFSCESILLERHEGECQRSSDWE